MDKINFIETTKLGPNDPWITLEGPALTATGSIFTKGEFHLPFALRVAAVRIAFMAAATRFKALPLMGFHTGESFGAVETARYRLVDNVPTIWIKATIPGKYRGQQAGSTGAVNQLISFRRVGFSVGAGFQKAKRKSDFTPEDGRFLVQMYSEFAPNFMRDLKEDIRRELRTGRPRRKRMSEEFRSRFRLIKRLAIKRIIPHEVSLVDCPADTRCWIDRSNITFFVPKRKKEEEPRYGHIGPTSAFIPKYDPRTGGYISCFERHSRSQNAFIGKTSSSR